jgi:hypothetical protein
MRHLRLPFLLALFTFVTWADEHGRGGILFSDWELRQITSSDRAVTPYTFASLKMEPVAAATSAASAKPAENQPESMPDVEGSANSASDEPDSTSEASATTTGRGAPPVPIEDMCVAMRSAAIASELPVGFFARLIWQESKFGQWVVSRAGAMGVAQFMPKTASWIGLSDPFDPFSALPASARFLHMLREQFGNLGLAAAAYNGGPGRVMNWLAGRSGLPEETRNYVRIVTGHEIEKWMEPRQIEVSYNLPARAPCGGLAGLSHQAHPRKIDVTVDPAIAKLIEAKAEAAAKAAARQAAKKAAKMAKSSKGSKAATSKKLAGKKGNRAKVAAGDRGGKKGGREKVAARDRGSKKSDAKKKTASGRPLNIATN